MSIPDRLFRIARYKLSEIKDHIDRLDEEAQTDEEARRRLRRAEDMARTDSSRELDDALQSGSPTAMPAGKTTSSISTQAPPPRRTPEEIRQASLGAASTRASRPPTTTAVPTADPLLYHYRLLGVEQGADFSTVQDAYQKLAARCDLGRFPAGSEEAAQAAAIRERLDTSYKALRDALDLTARRFDLLEFDSPIVPEETKD